MRNVRKCVLGLLILGLTAWACAGEDVKPEKFYKLDFVVKEVEGTRILNARTYSVIVSTEKPAPRACSIRAGGKVPYSTGKDFTYLDVGVNIDCLELNELPNGLSFWVEAEISSVVPESTTNPDHPYVRQNKWRSRVLVPLKRSVVLFSSDDLTGKQQTQIEVTATPIQ